MKKFLNKISNFNVKIPVPIFGVGCGVLGMSLGKVSLNLGQYASTLLKALEYRGYDSTGACFKNEDKITLLKDVGKPSTLVKTLGIEKEAGKIFCGQVRWATFGQVNKTNAQPHWVKCKTEIFGAHNGNITNTRALKNFLLAEGHDVLSDNDGEMLVHVIEHYFDIELRKFSREDRLLEENRKPCMRRAIILAGKKCIGSYAAVICDPVTEVSWCIKSGSSLYFGVGEINGEKFGLASSDLTAVLRFTKNLVNLREGEFVEYTSDYYQVYAQKNLKFKKLVGLPEIYLAGDEIDKHAVRSKLRAEDTELNPDYKYFMEQEIFSEPQSTGRLMKLFQGGSNSGDYMRDFLKGENLFTETDELATQISATEDFSEKKELFDAYMQKSETEEFYTRIKEKYPEMYEVTLKENFEDRYFFSSEKNTLLDLVKGDYNINKMLVAKALDSHYENIETEIFFSKVESFIELIRNTYQNKGSIYSVACGTSYNATKTAALFFNEIAGIEIVPILPGDFRGEFSSSLNDNDLIIGVSQSGETKDLIDIFNDIDRTDLKIKKVVLVNNMNSTLGQEKSDVAIPINCGPEIAVPATKSFMNQLFVFYFLAIETAKMMLEERKRTLKPVELAKKKHIIAYRWNTMFMIPQLLQETVDTTRFAIEEVAKKIFLEPSMHILATKISGVALEGSLKIRETLLNHTEGREASEFKHGPNTILGINTVFGLKSVKNFMKNVANARHELVEIAHKNKLSDNEINDLIIAMKDYIFDRITPYKLSPKVKDIFNNFIEKADFFSSLYSNYTLIYVTGPDDRDVNLTISQINTHKIRGANTFVFAEENDKLMVDVSKNPFNSDCDKTYDYGYVKLPKTGDTLLTCFSASIAFQLLALKMSILKMEYLDKLGIEEHGVHPDVPKNVSKSITVD